VTSTGPRNAPDVVDIVDVVALGESMVTFLPSRPGRLADVPSFRRAAGRPRRHGAGDTSTRPGLDHPAQDPHRAEQEVRTP
jgi:hypothetical protein